MKSRVFLLAFILLFISGVVVTPNPYQSVDALPIPTEPNLVEEITQASIETNVWHVGQDVSVDLNFMPMIPQRIEYSLPPHASSRESFIVRSTGTYGALYEGDTNYLIYVGYSPTHASIATTYVGGTLDLFYELRYTDVATLEYDILTIGNEITEFSISYLQGYVTDFEDYEEETIFSETIGSGAALSADGSHTLGTEHVSGGFININIIAYGISNTEDTVYYNINLDQFILTFNSITDSEYHTEYLQETDGSIIHRIFVECPEYKTEIAVDIPTHWVFDRTIPECDSRVSDGILYLENNTLPVNYEILFTETTTETTHEDSITSFSETTDDDVMFYPDVSATEAAITASSGELVGGSEVGSYTDTFTDNTVYWKQSMASPSHIGGILNFTHSEYIEQQYGIESGEIFIEIKGNSITNGKVSVYNYATDEWEGHQTLTIDNSDHTYTLTLDSDNIESLITRVRYNGTTGGGGGYLWCDYAISTIEPLGCLADDDHYAEGFNDVSDWDTINGFAMTSDGDLGLKSHPGDAGYDYEQTSDPSVLGGCFIETRFRVTVDGSDAYRVYVSTEDDYGGDTQRIMNNAVDTNWKTAKIYCDQDVETVRLGFATNNADAVLQIDYLRIFPANESGWQHDGSATVGYTESAYADSSTDGDLLTLTSTDTVQYVDFWFDNTDTQGTGHISYYHYFEAKVTDCDDISDTFWIRVYQEDNNAYTDVTGGYTGGEDGVKIWRASLKATIDDFFKVRVYLKTSNAWVVFDYLKVYSIADFTPGGSGLDINDVMYTDDSGNLIMDNAGGCEYSYIGTPAGLSVAKASYPIWNIAVSDASIVRFREVAGSNIWHDIGDSRGLISSSTLSNFFMYNWGDGVSNLTVSAITFVVVSNNPIITDVSYTPNPADEDESITFTVSLTDSSYPMTVSMNAIEYPSGFSDTDYDFTMVSFESWTYTFTTMTAGFYRFLVTADNTLIDTYEVSIMVTRASMSVFIRIFNNLGEFIPYETFEVYKNGTRQYTDTFSGYSDEEYQIQIKDRFGETLNTTTFDAGTEELVVLVDVYSLKFMSWYDGFCKVNITHGGITYQEVVMPMEVIEFLLYNGTYTYEIDYLNGTGSAEYSIDLTNSTGVVITGSTISDIMSMSEQLWDLVYEVNVTITATNNYVLTITIDLDNMNTTIGTQLIQVLLNITNTNSTIYDQAVDLLAYVQNVNTTLYEQVASFIIGVYNNQSTILSQTIDVLTQLNLIGSNVTANYISLSSELNLIDSSLASNFTSVVAVLTAIGSNITSNYITLAATLSAIDSSLFANFTSISATMTLLDTSAISNFISVIANFTAIGSNITANYLSLAAVLSAIDSHMLSNFTSVSAALMLIDSNLLSNFTSVTSTLSAIGSNITTNYLSVAALLLAIDSSLLSNFTAVTATLSAIGTNITSNYLDVIATLSLIDSQLLSNFTNIVSQLLSVNSSIATQFITIIAYAADMNTTMYLIDDPTHLNPLVLGYSLTDDYCDFTVVTTWHNASISIYDNDVLRAGPISELLSPIRYSLLGTSGTHNLSLFIDGGTDSFWYNISYTVVVEEIVLYVYTLIGASSDFDYMHYSFHITHDCTFIIEEWSDTWSKNETHTGVVYEGDNTIAWDKIGVTDIDANYTITFTNGTLTLVVEGFYITAYKLLRITDIDYDNLESSDNWVTNLTINFYTNKDVDWYIYDRDNNDAVLTSGSSVEGSDYITWVQNTQRGAHFFAVKWTDGVSDIWFNSSYWIYDRNIDDLPVGGDLGADDRRSIQMWTTIGAVIGFLGICSIAAVYFKLDEAKKLQLPNYPTQPPITREQRRREEEQRRRQ